MQLIRLRLLLLVLLTSIGLGAQAPAAFAVVDAAAPPDAVDDAETVRSGHEEFLDLTVNDTDPDFDPLTITAPTPGIPTATAHGTVTCEAFSGCSYISATGYSGADSFNYTISDGNGRHGHGHRLDHGLGQHAPDGDRRRRSRQRAVTRASST